MAHSLPPPHGRRLRDGFEPLQWARQVVDARMGIAARLTLAFVAVAALVLGANLFAEYGISIVRTTRVERVERPVSAPPAPVAVERPRVRTELVAPLPDRNAVLAAAAGFDRSVRHAIEKSAVEQGATPVLSATRELLRQTTAYVTQARDVVDGVTLAALTAQTAAYAKSGEQIVRNASARREILGAYSSRFDQVDARMKASLDRTWKIFGRVIARQSLIDLGRSLDDIRRRSAPLGTPSGYDTAAIDALASSQLQFATELEENARDLARSQGAEWVAQMRVDFAEIVSLRTQLVLTDQERARNMRAFDQQGERLVSAVRAIVGRPGAVSRAAEGTHPEASSSVGSSLGEAQPAASLAGARPPGAAARGKPLANSPPSTSAKTAVTTSTTPPDETRRVLMAWASGAVLLLLLAISVATVLSVVRPVRRFIDITRRLAKGDTDARVPRGGLRELDTLAVAFNQMADQLAAAQAVAHEYQTGLEGRVEERTRQLQYLAEHDPLTQLPNRRQLGHYLDGALARAAAAEGHVGVLFLDLDNFKTINDSMGHAFGDRVLQAIGQRIREVAGPEGFAARLGGDEFTVVCESAPDVHTVYRIGEALVTAFQKPLLIDKRDLVVSVSIGASVFPDHAPDPEALLRAADAALFHAKALGRSQLSVFSPELLEVASSKFRIEQGLRRALEHGELELLFQPEVAVDTFSISLVEALLRWKLPDGTHVAPGHFLAVAEESGLIMDISEWVLKSAVEFAANWHHGVWPGVRVAINVSSRQLLDGRFVDRVSELLAQHRLPARCIEIELTENVLQTGPATIESLRRLRGLGIAIALDDFGTGYSSLTSLEQLPLTRVKLDRSLIASIDESPRSLAIAQAIIGLCSSLGLEVTAEGIERSGQLALLWNYSRMHLQGYLLSRPIAPAALPNLLAHMPSRMQTLLLTTPNTSSERAQGAPAAPGPQSQREVQVTAESAVSDILYAAEVAASG
ncbi:MAG: EAL domain-containing protein [Gammaproteobacteria bacterium]